MTTPIKEDIAADLLTALNEVTTDNDFNFTITGTRTFRIDYANTPPANQTFIIAPEEEEEDAESAIKKKTWRQNYVISLNVIDSDFATTTIETPTNRIEADIRKKLREDPKRNSLALDTIMMPSTQLPENASFTGIDMHIQVHYRTNENNPYEK